MNKHALRAAFLLLCLPAWAEAGVDPESLVPEVDQQNQPYSFDYRFFGPDHARPVQVFGSGGDIYVQFGEGITPKRAEVRRGVVWMEADVQRTAPYYLIRGVGNDARIETNRGVIQIQRMGETSYDLAQRKLKALEGEQVRKEDALSEARKRLEEMRMAVSQVSDDLNKPGGAQSAQGARADTVAMSAGGLQPAVERTKRASGNGGRQAQPERGVYEIQAGAMLSANLRQLLEARGWNLVWQFSQNRQVPYGFQLQAEDVPAFIERVAALYGIPYQIYLPNKVVVIGESDRGGLR